jgi:transcriptional regulator GlxA family with amidase domain
MAAVTSEPIVVAILLFDRMTALDAIGPYEVLGRVPGATLAFVAAEPGLKRTDQGLGLSADTAIASVPHPDVVVIPGGAGEVDMRADERVLEWIRTAHETTRWTTSVCTGSLVLGAAGVLEGKRATSHWLALEQLPQFGAEPTLERVVIDGKIMTAAGVSAGIDMGLTLAARLAGDEVAQTIQLGIEYDPQPPFDAGSPSKAPAASVDFLRRGSRFVLTGES